MYKYEQERAMGVEMRLSMMKSLALESACFFSAKTLG
jgi:hypothetical protein